jgi:hypothetical protein
VFFHYRQNNSGGWFKVDSDAGISVNVIVEADSSYKANWKAQDIGLYFNGVDNDRDCGCCGDRWDSIWDSSDGDEVPSIYGRPVHDPKALIGTRWAKSEPEGFIHYADGSMEAIWADPEQDDPEGYWGEYNTRVTPWPLVEDQIAA